MDIDLLSKMVKELILDQDRVILPGLGSFVAEIVPSTFSDKGYTINPPYRRLYFRAKPDAGDDLVKLYSSSNNVKPEMAERIIVDFISELKSVLYEKKTVVFPGLGRLRATKENHLFFVADENLDIYPEGFGLEPISLKTHHETPEQVTAVVEDLKSFITMPEPMPEPVAKQEPEPEPQEEPVSEALPVEDPQPQPEPQPVEEVRIEPIPEQVPEPVAEVVPEQISVPAPKKDRKVLWVCVAVLSVVALMFLGLAVLGRVCPDVVDPLLYSPEDLKIVRML
jgi:nucleoid DNA-binding protein